MNYLHWVKMPSQWIANGFLKDCFSGNSKIGEDIAALKVYIALVYSARQVPDPLVHSRKIFEVKLTYDEMTELCSLSRLLVSKGLKKLEKSKLITSRGKRSKVYTLVGIANSGWCKLPMRKIIGEDMSIPFMKALSNRMLHERDALKIYLYLLSIRSNNSSFIEVSRGTISKKTGVKVPLLEGAIGFLSNISLLSNVEHVGTLMNSGVYDTHTVLVDRYFPMGSEYLPTKKSNLLVDRS